MKWDKDFKIPAYLPPSPWINWLAARVRAWSPNAAKLHERNEAKNQGDGYGTSDLGFFSTSKSSPLIRTRGFEVKSNAASPNPTRGFESQRSHNPTDLNSSDSCALFDLLYRKRRHGITSSSSCLDRSGFVAIVSDRRPCDDGLTLPEKYLASNTGPANMSKLGPRTSAERTIGIEENVPSSHRGAYADTETSFGERTVIARSYEPSLLPSSVTSDTIISIFNAYGEGISNSLESRHHSNSCTLACHSIPLGGGSYQGPVYPGSDTTPAHLTLDATRISASSQETLVGALDRLMDSNAGYCIDWEHIVYLS